jgi:hypothetical protein
MWVLSDQALRNFLDRSEDTNKKCEVTATLVRFKLAWRQFDLLLLTSIGLEFVGRLES